MASVLYNKIIDATARGAVDFATNQFKVMLVTDAYVPNPATHNFRSDVTFEVTGAGYTAGGKEIPATVTRNDAANRVDVAFANVDWPAASFTARGAVIYVSRGGAAAADELVAYVDFGANKTVAGDMFVFTTTRPLSMIRSDD